jgi:hypothetical protein
MSSKQTVYNILASKPVKVNLATVQDLNNLTGNIIDRAKEIDQLTSDVKAALSLVNKAVNSISNMESTQELVQKELNTFRVDAKKLGIMADEVAEYKRLNNTLVASLRSLGSLIIAVENISNVTKKV